MAAVADIYLEEVHKRAEAAARRCTAAREDPDAATAAAAAEPFTCTWRCASELSVAEARAHAARFQPLVITDVEGITDPWPWTLDWLVASIGSKRAAVNVGGSQTAGVTVAGTEVITVAELADRIGRGECVYLYDCSIPLKLPALTERLGVPAWFVHDWLHRTREPHAFSRSWPSLFVGAPGTRSSLHIDQWKGHFWMCQLEGCKRWTIFHPDDAWCLSPSWDASQLRLEPSFPDLDAMEADPAAFPLLRHARRIDLTLTKYQVLLVPGGAPHRVVNGDGGPSVAVAGNFVDASNAPATIADLRLMAGRAAGAPAERGCAAAARGLAELDLEAEAAPDAPPARHGVPWRECVRGAAAEWLAEEARRMVAVAVTGTAGDGRQGRDSRAAEGETDGGGVDDDDVSYFEQPPEWE